MNMTKGGTAAEAKARLIALIVPAGLLAGAYIAQYGFGLYPCDMCWWQRYPHFAAVLLALVAFVAQPPRIWILLAGVAIFASGVIVGFHAGVEYDWWEGFTSCSSIVQTDGDPLAAIMEAPLVRCDSAPWDLFGISLAGWNFLISCGSGILIWALLFKRGNDA